MRYKKDPDHLYLFITISIIIHFLFFVFFPYGNFTVMGNEGEVREFSFIQMVEFQEDSSQSDNNIDNEFEEETQDELIEKDNDEVINEEEEKLEEVEDIQEEANEIVEETESVNEESEIDENTNVVPEEDSHSETNDDPVEELVSEEDNLIEDNNNDTDLTTDDDILTGEDTDLEIEVEENLQEDIPEDTNSIDEDLSKESEELEPASNEKDNNQNETRKEETPPPPPTIGDLLLGAPRPVYPKDLQNEEATGEVILDVHISSSGEVETVRIINSSGYEQMDRTAQLTIERGWNFNNYQSHYSIEVTVSYMIDENGNPDVIVTQDNLSFK